MGRTLAQSIRPDGIAGKALSPSGSAVVGQEFTGDPIAMGRPALGLLDVVPVVQHTIPEFAYLRQTTRIVNAAVVAAGAWTPTSVRSVTRIESALAVIAHLSEPIPRHWLLDNASLETFLDAELTYGLQVAVAAKVVADVNGTSGIQTAPYGTSVLAMMLAGIPAWKLPVASRPRSCCTPRLGWGGAGFGIGVGGGTHWAAYDPATRRLFGVPVAVSNAQAPGVGHVVAQDAIALDTDTRGVVVTWSENAH